MNKPIKICFIAGAHSVHTRRWVSFFAHSGHDVHLISLGAGGDEEISGVRLYFVPRKGLRWLRPFGYASAVKRILRDLMPDIVHAHQVWVDGVLAALCGVRPLVITPWGSDVLLLPPRGVRTMLSRRALRVADLITCDGENTRAAVLKMGVPHNRVEIIRFGTDVERFAPRAKDAELLSRYNLRSEQIVVSLRNFNPHYDLATLVRAVPLVRQSVPEAVFLLVGDGSMRGQLKELAANLGVEDAVVFVGAVPDQEIPCYLNLADAYVSTSLSDSGLAASTAEAMASGVPVVVTNSGDNTSWIKDGCNGYVVPCGDEQALADRLVRVLTDTVHARYMGDENRRSICARNNYQVEMKRMETFYTTLVSTRGRR